MGVVNKRRYSVNLGLLGLDSFAKSPDAPYCVISEGRAFLNLLGVVAHEIQICRKPGDLYTTKPTFVEVYKTFMLTEPPLVYSDDKLFEIFLDAPTASKAARVFIDLQKKQDVEFDFLNTKSDVQSAVLDIVIKALVGVLPDGGAVLKLDIADILALTEDLSPRRQLSATALATTVQGSAKRRKSMVAIAGYGNSTSRVDENTDPLDETASRLDFSAWNGSSVAKPLPPSPLAVFAAQVNNDVPQGLSYFGGVDGDSARRQRGDNSSHAALNPTDDETQIHSQHASSGIPNFYPTARKPVAVRNVSPQKAHVLNLTTLPPYSEEETKIISLWEATQNFQNSNNYCDLCDIYPDLKNLDEWLAAWVGLF